MDIVLSKANGTKLNLRLWPIATIKLKYYTCCTEGCLFNTVLLQCSQTVFRKTRGLCFVSCTENKFTDTYCIKCVNEHHS